jgi:predicted MFS family arabinose efflux permease
MNQIIFWLSAVAFIIVAIMRVTDPILPILPILASEFDLTVGKASIVVTAFAVPYGLFQLLCGPLGDHFGKLRIIVVALAASSIFTLLCALATSIELLAAFQFFAGIATAAVVPLSMAFIADHFAYEVRQPVIARYLSGLVMGQIAGGSLGGIMAELFGWRVIFLVFGIIVGGMTYFVWRFSNHHVETLRPAPLYGRQLFTPYLDLLRQERSRHVITTATIEGFFFFGASAFLGAFLHDTFGLGYAWVGLMLACFGIGSLIYSRTANIVIETLGERGMVIAGSITMSLCYLALALAPSWQACTPVLIICGFGFYLMHNTLQTLATELAPDARGTAVSLFAFCLIIGQGAGVAFLGSVIDRFGYPVAFALVAVVILCVGLWFQGKLKREPPIGMVT